MQAGAQQPRVTLGSRASSAVAVGQAADDERRDVVSHAPHPGVVADGVDRLLGGFDVDLERRELPDDAAGRGIALARLAVDELAYEHVDGVNPGPRRQT